MKTIGLIGGMSWESTQVYYQVINELVRERCGGLSSAKLVMHSVNFAEISPMMHEKRWDEVSTLLGYAARNLELSGADCIGICSNTMHFLVDRIAKHVSVPIIHIADATGKELANSGLLTVGLLGTRFTMEKPFYKDYLAQNYGVTTIVPEKDDRQLIHDVIFNELCLGEVENASRLEFARITESLQDRGAQGIIMGCTEICLLLSEGDVSIPLIDTTWLHVQALVDFALA